MTAAQRPWAAELLHFWFHELRSDQWFGRNDFVDAELRRPASIASSCAKRRRAEEFLGDPLTARAAVLLFDQVPRNLFRDSARAFACDPLARTIAKGIMAKGWDRTAPKISRQFIYMPLMHSEAIADQRQCLRRFAALGNGNNLRFARAHYGMIARFGRFPHRNEVLGRRSTPEEIEAVREGNAW